MSDDIIIGLNYCKSKSSCNFRNLLYDIDDEIKIDVKDEITDICIKKINKVKELININLVNIDSNIDDYNKNAKYYHTSISRYYDRIKEYENYLKNIQMFYEEILKINDELKINNSDINKMRYDIAKTKLISYEMNLLYKIDKSII